MWLWNAAIAAVEPTVLSDVDALPTDAGRGVAALVRTELSTTLAPFGKGGIVGDTARHAFPSSVCVAGPGLTGNLYPLLHEIRHALEALLSDGTETAIDLRAIPMSPAEEQHIEAFLGAGEVRARIDAIGPSEILETAVPGVWLITHCNADDEVIARLIEITYSPSILRSQPEDMRAGLESLQQRLGELAQDA